jgi:hypothetical protein
VKRNKIVYINIIASLKIDSIDKENADILISKLRNCKVWGCYPYYIFYKSSNKFDFNISDKNNTIIFREFSHFNKLYITRDIMDYFVNGLIKDKIIDLEAVRRININCFNYEFNFLNN